MSNHKQIATKLTVLLLTVGIGSSAIAAGSCKNVYFYFTNSHSSGGPITVTSVDYWDDTSEKTRWEQVADVECGYGDTCHTGPDDLGSAFDGANGHNINQVRFRFKYRDGSSWETGEDIWHNESSGWCSKGRHYGAYTIN